jgi:hypothetical protein
MTCAQQGSGWLFTGSQPGAAGYCADFACVIRAAEADATLAILNHPDLFTTVHGALVSKAGRSALIVGPSLSGKSTLAVAMAAAGCVLHCDDVAILHSHAGGIWTGTGVPRRVSLRESSRALLGEPRWRDLLSAPASDATEAGLLVPVSHLVDGRPQVSPSSKSPAPAPLTAIIFLNRSGAPPASAVSRFARPIHPADALLALCAYTNVVRSSGGMARGITRLAPLIENVPAYDVPRSDLSTMVESLITLLAEPLPMGHNVK